MASSSHPGNRTYLVRRSRSETFIQPSHTHPRNQIDIRMPFRLRLTAFQPLPHEIDDSFLPSLLSNMPCICFRSRNHLLFGLDSARQSTRIIISSDNLHSFQPSSIFSIAKPIAGSGSLDGPKGPVTQPCSWLIVVLMNITESLCEVLKALMSFRANIGRSREEGWLFCSYSFMNNVGRESIFGLAGLTACIMTRSVRMSSRISEI